MSSQLGITFSSNQIKWLNLNVQESLDTCLSWPINFIRIGAHWDEVEPVEGEYNFEPLMKLLQICESSQKKVVLTVGVKAPRWPEFYFPDHVSSNLADTKVQEKLFTFIKKTVETLRPFSCISHWQIENEPLDPSGPLTAVVPLSVLEREIEIVKVLDSRPIVISLWGNDLSIRGTFPKAEKLGDIIGLDIYYKQYLTTFLNKSVYRGPLDSDKKLQKTISKSSKPVWITELQAEPWESSTERYLSDSPESMNIVQLQKNWQRALNLQAEVIFFWGIEYWLWQKQTGNNKYVEFIRQAQ